VSAVLLVLSLCFQLRLVQIRLEDRSRKPQERMSAITRPSPSGPEQDLVALSTKSLDYNAFRSYDHVLHIHK
jgi:hypothetical protein